MWSRATLLQIVYNLKFLIPPEGKICVQQSCTGRELRNTFLGSIRTAVVFNVWNKTSCSQHNFYFWSFIGLNSGKLRENTDSKTDILFKEIRIRNKDRNSLFQLQFFWEIQDVVLNFSLVSAWHHSSSWDATWATPVLPTKPSSQLS